MDELTKIATNFKTPIEIALGIDNQGMTTAKSLYGFLGLKPSNYARWIKRNIFDNEFAEEGVDYYSSFGKSSSSEPEEASASNKEGFFFNNPAQDYKLTAHFAKKLSMKGTGERAEQAREYFTHIEEKAKELVVNRSQLSPELQMFIKMGEVMARQELEQKRQAIEIENIKESQQAIAETFQRKPEDDFKTWVNKCVGKIAESSKYPFRGSDKDKYKQIRYESYERLNKKKPCRLNQRVEAEKGRAFSAGASTTKISAINKLTIIEGDKALKPIYETVIKEMMIAYCVK